MNELFPLKIATALVLAQKKAEAVAKASKNTFQGYKYASAEAIIAESREALNAADLALFTTSINVVPSEIEGVGSKVAVHYLLVHTSGESWQCYSETSIIPEKGRPQDKAESTALTYNLAYFLRNLLQLPREDEGASVDKRDDREHVPNTPIPVADDITTKINAAKTIDELRACATEMKARNLTNNPSVRSAYNAKYTELKSAST